MRDWVRNLISPTVRERVAGTPPSQNGASSFHLWWDVPYGERLTGASVTIEVTRRPELDRLVFFALQVAFIKPGGGGAHLGLQHHPGFPERCAANWGGYDPHGGHLDGSTSSLPSATDNLNTRDFMWHQGRPYRLEISRSHQRDDGMWVWPGAIIDMASGERVVVRDLYSPGAFLRGPVMWVESFAPCDAPRTEVRWTSPQIVLESGEHRTITAMRVDYQPHAAGGCTNTNAVVDGDAFVQRTGQLRTVKAGSMISIV